MQDMCVEKPPGDEVRERLGMVICRGEYFELEKAVCEKVVKSGRGEWEGEVRA